MDSVSERDAIDIAVERITRDHSLTPEQMREAIARAVAEIMGRP